MFDIDRWIKQNKDYIKEYQKRYYEANKAKILARHNKYNNQHVDEIKVQHKEYKKRNPDIVVLTKLRANAKRGLREVSWGQEGIKEFYLNKPKDLTVDHIIPLQGKKVSGLHVSWNLQYLTHPENSSKQHNCTPKEATKFYEKILVEAGLK
jgi:5-methylcytosine-specific restriction endonuclease McrA